MWHIQIYRYICIFPFAAMWIDLKGIILSVETEKDKYYNHLHVESKKYYKLVNKTKREADSQIQRANQQLQVKRRKAGVAAQGQGEKVYYKII